MTMLEEAIHLGDSPDICPYLPSEVATFRVGDGLAAAPWYRQLLDLGYRRSGFQVYRPVCRMCAECRTLRVPVSAFRRSKEQRRVWNRCHGRFEIQIGAPAWTPEKRLLYSRYLRLHHGSDRSETSGDEDSYTRFLVDSCLAGRTFEVQYRRAGRLAGVGILDRVKDALSSVYFYFEPDFARYSLGTYSALYEINLAARWGLAYYYLGYYIRGCASMSYKMRFRPCEHKAPDETAWTRVE